MRTTMLLWEEMGLTLAGPSPDPHGNFRGGSERCTENVRF